MAAKFSVSGVRKCPNRIRRRGGNEWPCRSPGLILLDYFKGIFIKQNITK